MNTTIDTIDEEEKEIVTKILDDNIPFELKETVDNISYNITVPLKYALKRAMVQYSEDSHSRKCVIPQNAVIKKWTEFITSKKQQIKKDIQQENYSRAYYLQTQIEIVELFIDDLKIEIFKTTQK